MKVRPGVTRRQVLPGMAAAALGGVAPGAVIEEAGGPEVRAVSTDAKPGPVTMDTARHGILKEHQTANHRGAQTIIGKLSGKKITIPDVDAPPMPALAPPGVVHDGKKAENFGEAAGLRARPSTPDVAFRRAI